MKHLLIVPALFIAILGCRRPPRGECSRAGRSRTARYLKDVRVAAGDLQRRGGVLGRAKDVSQLERQRKV